MKYKKKYATGGNVGGNMNLWAGVAQGAISIADLLINDPSKSMTNQPIYNASTMRGMVNPYKNFALGGEVDFDLDQIAELQMMADEQGISLEELIAQLQNPDTQDSTDDYSEEEEFAVGGEVGPGKGAIIPGVVSDDVYSGPSASSYANPFEMYAYNAFTKRDSNFDEINKELNALYNSHYTAPVKLSGGEVSRDITPINANQKATIINELINYKKFPNNSKGYFADLRKRGANDSTLSSLIPAIGFALGENFAYGGLVGKRNVELEGDEVIETPDGEIGRVKGPKHENGGVDMTLPVGTKVFSDRLKIDGKTMQQRKTSREKREARLTKLFGNDPSNIITKNSLARVKEINEIEEAEDMMIQNAAQLIDNKKKFATGGNVLPPNYDFNRDLFMQSLFDSEVPKTLNPSNYGPTPIETPEPAPTTQVGLGVGDYVGLAGNAFNAIAPIINTLKNANATGPNINRFLGFGREGIEANDLAQDTAATQRTLANTEIDTATNAARNRNRNSVSGVNTLRALDAVTTLGANKAKVGANSAFTNQLLGLLSQRSQLENQQDQVVMTGEARRDMEDKADIDNFYSAMAQNLVNAGVNVQGIGKALNTNRSNNVDANLLAQLSRYDLGFDENGNLISTR